MSSDSVYLEQLDSTLMPLSTKIGGKFNMCMNSGLFLDNKILYVIPPSHSCLLCLQCMSGVV